MRRCTLNSTLHCVHADTTALHCQPTYTSGSITTKSRFCGAAAAGALVDCDVSAAGSNDAAENDENDGSEYGDDTAELEAEAEADAG